jgi:hypothetical protein
MLLLGEQEDLFAGIDQPTYGEDAIVFAYIRVEENRIPPGIDYFSPPWMEIALRDAG